MGMGPMAWACLLLTVHGAGTQESWYLNQRGFKIPIRIKAENRAELRELHLYVSCDQGQTWELQEKGPPDKDCFAFQANKDGTYWFTVSTVNLRGEERPSDVSRVPPMQKVVVDMTRPEVRILSADRRGADVLVTWHVQEDHPDPNALRVDYRTAAMPEGQWTPVPYIPGTAEQVSFQPVGNGEVQVRVQAVDLAGNRGEAAQPVAGGTPLGASATQASAVEAFGPVPGGPGDTAVHSVPGGAPPRLVSGPAAGAFEMNPLIPSSSGPPSGPSGPPATVSPPTPTGPMSPPAPLAPAFPGVGPAAAPPGSAAPLSRLTRGSLPALQVVKMKQVKLDFNVDKVGPSGLGSVEVYATPDEGNSWEQVPPGSDTVLPAATDGRSTGPVRGSVTVSLAREGIPYGFFIVVKSRAGIGKPPPQRGDTPQVRLELDATLPLAKLYAPTEDPARPNALILAWTAWDRNLAANPVILEWSERKEGPWAPISPEPLPNNLPEQSGAAPEKQNTPTGSYSWQIPDKMPPRVYLKLSVRDTAGNVAVAETRDAVTIDLTRPEVGSVTPNIGGN
jgi:hypothetical protein